MNPIWINAALGSVSAVLLGLAILAALRLHPQSFNRTHGDILHLMLRLLGRSLVTTGVIMLAIVVFQVFSFLLLIVTVVVLLFVWRSNVVARQYQILWGLSTAVDRGIPLHVALRIAGEERRDRMSCYTRMAATLLESGFSLSDTLKRVPHLLPPEARTTMIVGTECGASSAAIRRAAQMQQLDQPTWKALIARLIYFLCLFLVALGVLTFVTLKIVPQFVRIFNDFEIKLPPITQDWLSTMHWFGDHVAITIWPLFLLTVFLLSYAVLRYLGMARWDLPGMGRWTRRLDTVAILASLALVVKAQRPLVDGLRSLAACYPKGSIRQRLRLALVDIEQGMSWRDSLQAHGLVLPGEAAILAAAERLGNLAWALDELAASSRRRLAYRFELLIEMAFPAVSVVAGVVVFFTAVALFGSLVDLIRHLV